MELDKSDKDTRALVNYLFSKGYLLEEINKFLIENNIIKLLIYKIDRDIKAIPETILLKCKIVDNLQYFDKINEFNKKKTYSILNFKLNDILKRYKKKKNLNAKDYYNIKKIEDDIVEINELRTKNILKISN